MHTPDGLVRDLLKNQRSERRFKYIRMGLFTGLAGAYLLAAVVAFSDGGGAKNGSSVTQPHVAVVSLKGTIGPSEEVSYEGVRKHLANAFADQGAKAVILQINSPGGSPVQASLIHDEILALKKRHPGKKVIAIAEDYVASGGYFIAMAADELVVNRSTLTGSIGVISSGFGFTGLMEKLGVERRAFTAGESKNGMDPFSPTSPADVQKYQELLTGIHGHFKDVVLQSRKDKLKAEPSTLFTGAVWTGEQAVTLGLADGLGSLTTVMEREGAKQVVNYAPSPSLLRAIGFSVGAGAAKSLAAKVMSPDQHLN